jgi:hypothetical protein
MLVSKGRFIAAAIAAGLVFCGVLFVLARLDVGPSRPRGPRAFAPVEVAKLEIPAIGKTTAAEFLEEQVRREIEEFHWNAVLDLRVPDSSSDYPRMPIRPGENPRILPAMFPAPYDPAWPAERSPGPLDPKPLPVEETRK